MHHAYLDYSSDSLLKVLHIFGCLFDFARKKKLGLRNVLEPDLKLRKGEKPSTNGPAINSPSSPFDGADNSDITGIIFKT